MFGKLLIAIDLEIAPARAVISRALELASDEFWVAHAVEPQYVQYSIDPTFTGSLTRAMEEDALAAARSRLAEICEPFDIDADHQLVALGRVAEQIHHLAQEKEVDAIVIGSHAARGIRRLLGSTANAVLHGAPVNVLTIRLRDEGDQK